MLTQQQKAHKMRQTRKLNFGMQLYFNFDWDKKSKNTEMPLLFCIFVSGAESLPSYYFSLACWQWEKQTWEEKKVALWPLTVEILMDCGNYMLAVRTFTYITQTIHSDAHLNPLKCRGNFFLELKKVRESKGMSKLLDAPFLIINITY